MFLRKWFGLNNHYLSGKQLKTCFATSPRVKCCPYHFLIFTSQALREAWKILTLWLILVSGTILTYLKTHDWSWLSCLTKEETKAAMTFMPIKLWKNEIFKWNHDSVKRIKQLKNFFYSLRKVLVQNMGKSFWIIKGLNHSLPGLCKTLLYVNWFFYYFII